MPVTRSIWVTRAALNRGIGKHLGATGVCAISGAMTGSGPMPAGARALPWMNPACGFGADQACRTRLLGLLF